MIVTLNEGFVFSAEPAEVVIMPQGPFIILLEGVRIFLDCVIRGVEGRPEIRWRGPDNNHITATSGRLVHLRLSINIHRSSFNLSIINSVFY